MAGKRGNHEGSIRERKKGQWEARLLIGHNPNGSQKRKSFYGRTREEARDKMWEYQKYLDQKKLPHQDEEDKTVGWLLNYWLDRHVDNEFRPNTRREYHGTVKKHLIPKLGRTKLRELKVSDVQDLLYDKCEEGLAFNTIGGIKRVISSALNYAEDQEWVIKNVARRAKVPANATEPRKPVFLTVEQCHDLLRHLEEKGNRFEATISLGLGCGLRLGEALALKWPKIDLNKNLIDISHTLLQPNRVRKGWGDYFGPPKTKRSRRTVPIPEEIIPALLRTMEEQEYRRRRAGEQWEEWGLTFASFQGRPLDQKTVWYNLKNALAAVGLPDMRFHDLRHTFATFMLARGVKYNTLSKLMGHASVQITIDTYAHVLDEMEREARGKMGEMFHFDSLGAAERIAEASEDFYEVEDGDEEE